MPLEFLRLVAHTNLVISRLLLPQSVAELAEVLSGAKFDSRIGLVDRREFIRVLNRIGERVVVTAPVHAGRDPRDDDFLEVALHRQGRVILTGDRVLRALRPFRGVDIIPSRGYLER